MQNLAVTSPSRGISGSYRWQAQVCSAHFPFKLSRKKHPVMKDWMFIGFRPIEEASNVTDKSGQTPLRARKKLFFKDLNTGKISSTTDLEYKKKAKRSILDDFQRAYLKSFSKKKITIMLIVIKESKYPDISRFIQDYKKKLARRKIFTLGYMWVRDVGEVKFEKHIHLVLVTNRITGDEFRSMMSSRRAKGYDVELCNNVPGFKSYLRKKDLFGANRQRSFGRSTDFPLKFQKNKKNNLN